MRNIMEKKASPVFLAVLFYLSYLYFLDLKDEATAYGSPFRAVFQSSPSAIVFGIVSLACVVFLAVGMIQLISAQKYDAIKRFTSVYLITTDVFFFAISFPPFLEAVLIREKRRIASAFTDAYPDSFFYGLLIFHLVMVAIIISCKLKIKKEMTSTEPGYANRNNGSNKIEGGSERSYVPNLKHTKEL